MNILNLKAKYLKEIFPFHFVLNEEMTIIDSGNLLAKILPKVHVGDLFSQHFQIVHPSQEAQFKKICRRSDVIYLVKSLESAVQLKGQMIHISDLNLILFLCSPWVRDIESITNLGLTLKDFPIHDSITDFMFLLQAQKTSMEDLRILSEKLSRQNEELRHREELQRTLVNNFPGGAVILFDVDLNCMISGGTEVPFDLELDSLSMKSLSNFFPPQVWHELEPKLRETLSGKRQKFEKNYGNKEFLHITHPVYDSSGDIYAGILMLQNVTDHRKMVNEILRIQKLESIGVLAGGIAHDFNNLLTGVIGNISLAKIAATDPNMIKKYLGKMEIASNQAQKLTDQLLTFSKGGKPVRKNLSIAKLLRDSMEFMMHGSSLKYEHDIPENLACIYADAGQITQVMQNLILNAEQAVDSNGIIKLSGKNVMVDHQIDLIPLVAGSYVKISIQDSGCGISVDNLSKIFDPFYTTKQTGSGLGLATAFSVVKNHDGYIAAESEPGRGSVFTVYLPACEKFETQLPLLPKPESFIHQGRVLVMDDEQFIRELAAEIIVKIGYEVECAVDGNEAVQRYRDAQSLGRPFDCVVLDLTVPGGLGGAETIKKLFEFDPDVKAIVSSGYSTGPILSNYQIYGFSGIINKPYELKTVKNVIQKVLSNGNP